MLNLNSKSLIFIRNSQLVKKGQSTSSETGSDVSTQAQDPQGQTQQEELNKENQNRSRYQLKPFSTYEEMKRHNSVILHRYAHDLAEERRKGYEEDFLQNYNLQDPDGIYKYESSLFNKDLVTENNKRKSHGLKPFRNETEMNRHIHEINHRYHYALRNAERNGTLQKFMSKYPNVYFYEESLQTTQRTQEGGWRSRTNEETDAHEDYIIMLIINGEKEELKELERNNPTAVWDAKKNFPKRFPSFNLLEIQSGRLPKSIKTSHDYLDYLINYELSRYDFGKAPELREAVIEEKIKEINKKYETMQKDKQAYDKRQREYAAGRAARDERATGSRSSGYGTRSGRSIGIYRQ